MRMHAPITECLVKVGLIDCFSCFTQHLALVADVLGLKAPEVTPPSVLNLFNLESRYDAAEANLGRHCSRRMNKQSLL